MKRLLSILLAASLCISLIACTAAPAVAETVPTPTAAPELTAAPTPEPTPTLAPAPSPTPEPVYTETALSQELFRRAGVSITAVSLRFAAGYEAIVTLSIESAAKQSVTVSLDGAYLNDWRINAALEGAENILPGETRGAALTFPALGAPPASDMNIAAAASIGCNLVVTDAGTGETLASQAAALAVPGETAASPADGAALVYEDNNLAVYLQGIDGSLERVRAILYRKPSGGWKSATIGPVYAGYTNLVNGTYALDAGKYLLLSLDGGQVMADHGISQLAELKLYITLNYNDGRINRPVIAVIPDPAVSQTVVNAPDPGPVAYETELAYCVLRYMGIIEFGGREAILLDFENITQNYIKRLDLTIGSLLQSITIDGVDYPIGTYCTYAFPETHGYLMLWPEGAPGGTLSSASTARVRLHIARINAGHLDPIEDTGAFTIDLTAK